MVRPCMHGREVGAVLFVFLTVACAAGSDAGPRSVPTAQGSARFSVTSYNVHRIRPLNAPRPKIRAEIWGENVGTAPGVPVCLLSYGTRGKARVPMRGAVVDVEPGNHFEVAGTATFDRRIPGIIESQNAWCRAAR